MTQMVNLYTRQHKNSLYELRKKGRITNKEVYVILHMMDISDFFTGKYRKFVQLAEKRLKRPEGVDYPIRCSLSKKYCLRPEENSLVYCLNVPRDQVIYFSSKKWDYVLNNLYIAKDEEDQKEYYRELKALGVTDEFNFIDGKYKGRYPQIEKKIEESRERIFDIDKRSDFSVQANLWEIKADRVKHIVYPGEDITKVARDMEDDIRDHRVY